MRRVVLAAMALVLLSACRVGVDVAVESQADGSGQVRARVSLDAEAAARVADLADQLEVDDLRAAGWEVTGPRPAPEGGVAVEAVKRYRGPAEATQVVEELSGPSGPFRHFRLRRSRSFLRTHTELSGTVDLRGGLAAFGDEALRQRLGGPALGLDPAALEREAGAPPAEVFRFEVTAELPGETRRWQPSLGEALRLTATGEQWNVGNLAASAIALVSGVAAVALAVRRLRGRP